MKRRLFFILLTLILSQSLQAQIIPAGTPVFEEALRRKQLLGELDSGISFTHRPLQLRFANIEHIFADRDLFAPGKPLEIIKPDPKEEMLIYLPIRNSTTINTGRPYGYGNGLMIPNVGVQNYITGGVYGKYKFLEYQLMPELVVAQNAAYQGYVERSNAINRSRFYFWNQGDFPERFGNGVYSKLWFGQSKLTASVGGIEAGISSQQIWWGPGQFNSLIFSNNSPGFLHFSLNTKRPLKTFLGSFEGQMIMGRLESSGFATSQSEELNNRYFRELNPEWRYVNGFHLTFQPKVIKGLSLGLTRVFQKYSHTMDKSFGAYFPIFEAFQKEDFFRDGHTVDYDGIGQDQQATIYARYLIRPANAEVYFEYGRRDHAVNWREFMVNPDHARAYMMGINKVFEVPGTGHLIQVRGEMTQQLESADRFVRYGELGGASWHHNSRVRGFTHYGQALGVGIGEAGSNVQTLEFSYIDKLNKYGILMERLANHQNFFYRSFGQQDEVQPWIDYSLALLLDRQWDKFMISSRLQFINGLNYQWQLDPMSTPEFPRGKDLFSVYAKVDFIYFLDKKVSWKGIGRREKRSELGE